MLSIPENCRCPVCFIMCSVFVVILSSVSFEVRLWKAHCIWLLSCDLQEILMTDWRGILHCWKILLSLSKSDTFSRVNERFSAMWSQFIFITVSRQWQGKDILLKTEQNFRGKSLPLLSMQLVQFVRKNTTVPFLCINNLNAATTVAATQNINC